MQEAYPSDGDIEKVYRRAAYLRQVFTDAERLAWDDVEKWGSDMEALNNGDLLDGKMQILNEEGEING